MTNLLFDASKRLLLGRPLRSAQLRETLLPKRLALPVFCSDPLSSNAYAPEQILLGLAIGGLALTHAAPWIVGAVIVLLVVVIGSYRQICRAYPSGGGAYSISRDNLGTNASLVAGSALVVDYVLTVAVSVTAGVANIASAVQWLTPYVIHLSVGLVAVLTLINLRGLRQSGRAFAIPVYGFIAIVFLMILAGAARILVGRDPVAESATFDVEATSQTTGLLAVAIVLRAFSQGSTALTGMEVVSNGVPHFRKPQADNAARTLAIMGAITVTMLAGITWLAVATGVRVAEREDQLIGAPEGYEQRTVITQVAAAVFGNNSALFFLLATFTAAILVLAANSAFNGFPVLASVLGQDGFLPRQFGRRGDRLVFSNGIVLLGLLAIALIWSFDADAHQLIQLYIIGVFLSFTFSQFGMVRHWTRHLRHERDVVRRRTMRRSRLINQVGACLTALVLLVILISKFTRGGWIVVIALPLVYATMKAIRRHYDDVEERIRPAPEPVTLPSRVHAILLVSRLHAPTLRALAYARATRPTTLTALTVQIKKEETDALMAEWSQRGISIPLTVLDSPYRDVTSPVLAYVSRIRRRSPRDLVSVFVPEYVVDHWWEQLLHNQSALRLKARLLFSSGVMVTSVPWQLGAGAIQPQAEQPQAEEPPEQSAEPSRGDAAS
ncbi:APC family permease [Kribbella sancticallisti]|uniref:APC family permease n=1 Tax=Kribbella sancticallisti TaxID=460087 RepID=A0ABN2DNP9_9ACTN